LKDENGIYYLHLYNGYMRAIALNGPWTVAEQASAGASTAENEARKAGPLDLLEVPKIPRRARGPRSRRDPFLRST